MSEVQRKRPPLNSEDHTALWGELRHWLERMQHHGSTHVDLVAMQDTMSSMESGRYRREDGS